MGNPNTIKIDEVEYIRKDSINQESQKLNGMDYVVIRSTNAGCFAGYLKEENGDEVILMKTRRLWYWDGAFTLSQLSLDGVKKPDQCKFSGETDNHKIKQVIEILKTTEQARLSLQGVKIWKQ